MDSSMGVSQLKDGFFEIKTAIKQISFQLTLKSK